VLEQPRRQDARSQGLDALGREVLFDEAGVWLQRGKVHPRDHSPVGVHPDAVMGSTRDRPTGELHDELSSFRRAQRGSLGWQAVDALCIGIRRNRRLCFCRSGLRRSWNSGRLGAIERQAGRNDQERRHHEGTTTDHPPPSPGGHGHRRWDALVVLKHVDRRARHEVARRLRLRAGSQGGRVGRRRFLDSVKGSPAPGTGLPVRPAGPVTPEADPLAHSGLLGQ
jgi:hypothetical protein